MRQSFTVFGAAGFLGRSLCRDLSGRGYEVTALGRDNWPMPGHNLGHAIFTIGMNANFRGRPFETYDAHIDRLRQVLHDYRFDSLLYVSSTRVYLGASLTEEYTSLSVAPAAPDHIFNISKLAGEALCLSQGNPAIRIARVSNLYGEDDVSNVFLTDVLREAVLTEAVTFHTAAASEKDYLHVGDAASALAAIALAGRQSIYNVASGQNTSNGEIAAQLEAFGVACRFEPGAPEIRFPVIDTQALRALGFSPRSLGDMLPIVFHDFKSRATESA